MGSSTCSRSFEINAERWAEFHYDDVVGQNCTCQGELHEKEYSALRAVLNAFHIEDIPDNAGYCFNHQIKELRLQCGVDKSGISYVEGLDLRQTCVGVASCIVPGQISQLRSLRYFRAAGSNTIVDLNSFQSLRELHIPSCTTNGSLSTLAHLQELETINLERTAIQGHSSELAHLRYLKYLHIKDTQIVSSDDSFSLMTRLEYLDISNTTWKSERRIHPWPGHTPLPLRVLRASSMQISSVFFMFLDDTLRELYLDHSSIFYEEYAQFHDSITDYYNIMDKLVKCQNLEVLSLRSLRGVSSNVSDLNMFRFLMRADFSGTSLAGNFVDFTSHANLLELNLMGTNVSGESSFVAGHLAKSKEEIFRDDNLHITCNGAQPLNRSYLLYVDQNFAPYHLCQCFPDYKRSATWYCKKCPLGKTRPSDQNSCELQMEMACVLGVVMIFLILLVYHAAVEVACYCGLGIRITDVSLLGMQTVATTSQPHGLSFRLVPHATVRLDGTGHYLMDEAIFRVTALDSLRLELLGAQGEPLEGERDASMGVLKLTLCDSLLCTGSVAPTIVMVSIVPLAIITLFAIMWAFDFFLIISAALSPAAIGVLRAWLWRSRASHHPTPMDQRQLQFQQQCPDPKITERGADRAITAGMIVHLYESFKDFIRGRSAHYLNANITKPMTSAHKVSYAELVGPCQVQFFVSHSWNHPFEHFTQAICSHARCVSTDDWRIGRYWMCTLSNNQWEIDVELGGGKWESSSFYKAMRSTSCVATCMVLDTRAEPLTRSWCLFEVLQTYLLQEERRSKFNGLFFCTSDGVLGSKNGNFYDTAVALAQRLVELNLADAKATKAEDQEMIMALVIQQMHTMENMNEFVRKRMAQNLRDVQGRAVGEMQCLLEELSLGRKHADDVVSKEPSVLEDAGPRLRSLTHEGLTRYWAARCAVGRRHPHAAARPLIEATEMAPISVTRSLDVSGCHV